MPAFDKDACGHIKSPCSYSNYMGILYICLLYVMEQYVVQIVFFAQQSRC